MKNKLIKIINLILILTIFLSPFSRVFANINELNTGENNGAVIRHEPEVSNEENKETDTVAKEEKVEDSDKSDNKNEVGEISSGEISGNKDREKLDEKEDDKGNVSSEDSEEKERETENTLIPEKPIPSAVSENIIMRAASLYEKEDDKWKVMSEYSGYMGMENSEPAKLIPNVKINKQISYLGNGVVNGDTDIQKDREYKASLKDFYRLYLDIEGEKLKRDYGTDLLIVLDTSSSMILYGDMKIPGKASYVSRREAVEYLVNKTDLIKNFLKMNPQNRVAIISFDGNGYIPGDDPEYNYNFDTAVIQEWSNSFSNARIDVVTDRGTNYDAALLNVENMFEESQNKKVMFFVSDGVPSYYIKYNGKRGGTGTDNIRNLEICRNETLKFIEEFYRRHPDILTYTVGISRDINSDGLTSSPVVLRKMAELGHGKYIGINYDMSELIDKLKVSYESVISNAVIKDKLSEYTELLSERPDFKVTEKNKLTGEEIVLWDKNGQTYANKNGKYIQSVRYDKISKEVVLKFNPNLELLDDIKYTVSFNIRTSKKAVDEFLEHGYNAIGDKNTDYAENDTSSGKEGFRSNKEATAYYSYGNNNRKTDASEKYPHPVVQVNTGVELPSTGGKGSLEIKYIGAAVITITLGILARKKKYE